VVRPSAYTRRVVVKLAVSAIAALVLAQPPAWIGRAIPPPIAAWVEADVLGNHYAEGIAVSSAGGAYFVGVAESRLDPPEMVLDYDLVRAHAESSVRWLRAGRLTGTAAKEIGVDVRVSRAGGERAWILRVEGRRIELLREFAARRIRLTGHTVELFWPNRHETWRFERGAYRLVARR
jgi:hypothetical protein